MTRLIVGRSAFFCGEMRLCGDDLIDRGYDAGRRQVAFLGCFLGFRYEKLINRRPLVGCMLYATQCPYSSAGEGVQKSFLLHWGLTLCCRQSLQRRLATRNRFCSFLAAHVVSVEGLRPPNGVANLVTNRSHRRRL